MGDGGFSEFDFGRIGDSRMGEVAMYLKGGGVVDGCGSSGIVGLGLLVKKGGGIGSVGGSRKRGVWGNEGAW